MTIPEAVTPPPTVAALAGTDPVRAVWRNELGGLTFEVGTGPHLRFVKFSPTGCPIDLSREVHRLRWAMRWADVPRVLASGEDASGSWLVTAALPGLSAVYPRWLTEPEVAVRAIGTGLRRLHETLPVELCPFDWSPRLRAQRARNRGQHDRELWSTEHRGLDPAVAWRSLDFPPPVDRLVVCSGDACAPNTLVGDDGTCTGQVDLGALGVADRWADLAVATWSTAWNYGPGWEDALLEAYGVDPDPERTRYYRLLWDLSP